VSSWNHETHSGVRNPRSQFFRSSLVHLSLHEAGSRRSRQRKAERVISDVTSVLSLQQEIQRSEDSGYDHRLHGVLLVTQGMTCPEVAKLLGDAPRSVEYWVHHFDQKGLGIA
jgi:hypothetical protein